MHSYAHNWACQMMYAVRFLIGMGLTNGESTEQLWALLRFLISITRTSSVGVSHLDPSSFSFLLNSYQNEGRIQLIDQQALYIASQLCDSLGTWITRTLKQGVELRSKELQAILEKCLIPVEELHREWNHQQANQSIPHKRAFFITISSQSIP